MDIHQIQQNRSLYRAAFEGEFTWISGFMRNVYRFGNRPALFDPVGNTTWTYRQLNTDANRLAHALQTDGISTGNVVMVQLLNCPEFIFSYVASHKLGAVFCPISFRLSAGEIAFSLEDSQPSVFLFDASDLPLIKEALSRSAFHPTHCVLVGDTDEPLPEGFLAFEDYVSLRSEEDPVPDNTPNMYDESTRLYTSGTTGLPKGVPLTSANEVLSAHDVMYNFPLNFTDKTMNTTPWFHRGGLHSGGPCPTLFAGGCVVIMRKFDSDICLEWTQKFKITFLIGVPTVLECLAEAQTRGGWDLSSLNGIVTMGSALERAACIRYQKMLTPNIFNGYGTTETFWNCFLRPFDLPDMAGTAGRACTDDEVRIVKVQEEGHTSPDDTVPMDGETVGEIIIKTPKASYQYFNKETETQRKFYNGFLYTSDLGTWDENQFISVVGRKDDMIISAGENIYPIQIEEILNEHPKVKDCIVTAVPDHMRGEVVTAYVVSADDSITITELDEYCQQHPMLSKFKRPRYYRFVEDIPINATGKKLHYKIKQYAKDDLYNGLLRRP